MTKRQRDLQARIINGRRTVMMLKTDLEKAREVEKYDKERRDIVMVTKQNLEALKVKLENA